MKLRKELKGGKTDMGRRGGKNVQEHEKISKKMKVKRRTEKKEKKKSN